jgi:outer membrane protein
MLIDPCRALRNWLRRLAVGVCCVTAVANAATPEDTTLFAAEPELAAVLSEADRLIRQQRAQDAYTRLSARELDWSGNPAFDYLLGVAALDSGKPRDAVFALERAVASQSDFLGARMELARAYFDSGDDAASRAQFEFLHAQGAPATTQAVIDRYIAAIEARESLVAARWSSAVQFGAGYDSNANGSTSASQFLGFTLDPRNVETSSGFAELGASIGHAVPTSPRSGITTQLQLTHRANPDASYVDQSVVSLGTTAVWQVSATRVSLGANGTRGWLDGEAHDVTLNLDLGAAWRFAGDWEFGLSGRVGSLRYDDERLEVLDAKRYLLGAAMTRANLGDVSGRVGMALLGGRDDARLDTSAYDNDRRGARVFAGWLLAPQASVYLEGSVLRAEYDAASFFGSDRRDEQYGATLALEFQNWPAPQWTVSPRARWMRNDSTVALYAYDRVEAALFVRRNF